MRVRVKLMGILKDKSPTADRLELPDGVIIEDALRVLEISTQQVAVYTVNGQLERDARRVLDDGDELTILPPVAGG